MTRNNQDKNDETGGPHALTSGGVQVTLRLVLSNVSVLLHSGLAHLTSLVLRLPARRSTA